MYSYIFEPRAAGEYENAFEWYEQQSEPAADKLIIDVEETLQKICNDPFRYRKTYKQLREISLGKYPYIILYLVDDKKLIVSIISLFHHKRNPKKKYRING